MSYFKFMILRKTCYNYKKTCYNYKKTCYNYKKTGEVKWKNLIKNLKKMKLSQGIQ